MSNNLPPSVLRLAAAPFLRLFFGGDAASDRVVHAIHIRDLHAEALGPGRRKRQGHFELRDERDVRD